MKVTSGAASAAAFIALLRIANLLRSHAGSGGWVGTQYEMSTILIPDGAAKRAASIAFVIRPASVDCAIVHPEPM